MTDDNTIYCPLKRGVIARGRCVEWRRKKQCTVTDCPHIHTRAIKMRPTETMKQRHSEHYKRWLIVKDIFTDGNEYASFEIADKAHMNLVSAHAMLRHYVLKGVLRKRRISRQFFYRISK